MTLRFRSKEAYRKFNAYRGIHGIETVHKQKVLIAGKPHHVVHEHDPHQLDKLEGMIKKLVESDRKVHIKMHKLMHKGG